MKFNIIITPIHLSLAMNALSIGALIFLMFRPNRLRGETTLQKLTVLYAGIFTLVSLCSTIETAMSSLHDWNELTSLQWFNLSCGVMANWGNTMIAFLSTTAQKIKQGGDILSTGQTQFYNKPVAVTEGPLQGPLAAPKPISEPLPPSDKPATVEPPKP